MLRVPCVWKFALSMRARECESKAHLFSIKMQFTCNTMRTLNTNHTDVLKENNKKRSKEKGTKSNISNNPHGIYIYFTKEDFASNAFCMKITFFGFAFFSSYGLYAYVWAANTWCIQWKLWWQGFSNDIHLHCLTRPKPSHRAYHSTYSIHVCPYTVLCMSDRSN